jgi:predicted nuclease of predicted toxin-antitoxin system
MKLLLDMGLAPRTADFLRGLGHDADHLGKRGLPRLPDPEIMALAASEGRVAVTFDLEFSRVLALQRLVQPSVILFRLDRFTTDEVNSMLSGLLSRYESELNSGAIIVIEPHRVRVRSLPIW